MKRFLIVVLLIAFALLARLLFGYVVVANPSLGSSEFYLSYLDFEDNVYNRSGLMLSPAFSSRFKYQNFNSDLNKHEYLSRSKFSKVDFSTKELVLLDRYSNPYSFFIPEIETSDEVPSNIEVFYIDPSGMPSEVSFRALNLRGPGNVAWVFWRSDKNLSLTVLDDLIKPNTSTASPLKVVYKIIVYDVGLWK